MSIGRSPERSSRRCGRYEETRNRPRPPASAGAPEHPLSVLSVLPRLRGTKRLEDLFLQFMRPRVSTRSPGRRLGVLPGAYQSGAPHITFRNVVENGGPAFFTTKARFGKGRRTNPWRQRRRVTCGEVHALAIPCSTISAGRSPCSVESLRAGEAAIVGMAGRSTFFHDPKRP